MLGQKLSQKNEIKINELKREILNLKEVRLATDSAKPLTYLFL
ncbi:MAG: hypothetical protein CM15mP85_24860 [Rhodobacterales bacterium]|nr:MAG: hypothetical protein CM15mP85_24860 [Rhodobacterales bacterium]